MLLSLEEMTESDETRILESARKAMKWDAASRARLRKARRHILLYALLIGLAIAVILPISWILASSFTTRETVWRNVLPFSWRAFFPGEFTLDGYRAIFEKDFGTALLNTFFLGAVTVLSGHRGRGDVGFRLRPPEVPLEELPLRAGRFQLHDPRRFDDYPLFCARARAWAGSIPGKA